MNRRKFLKISTNTLLGSSILGNLPQLLAKEEKKLHAYCENIIYLNMQGGMSHIDTFDPKPGASTQGKFNAIDASNGQKISEHLPKTAKLMKKSVVINSMTSKEGSHERGQYMIHTNYPPLGTVIHPSLGSWVAKYKDSQNENLPSFVTIGRSRYASAGYFGNRYEPLNINKASNGLANLNLPKEISKERFEERMDLLNALEEDFHASYEDKNLEAYQNYYQDAVKLMFSKDAAVFDINKEDKTVIQKYGDENFAQSCLLARRLVEKGVRCVEVNLGGWDTHNENFDRLETLLPILDHGLATLVSDLEQKKMLGKTLVVLGTEFGRTPKINGRDGRDHYPKAFSTVLFGGCLNGGTVIGKTDEEGANVVEKPVSIQDLNATLAYAIGLDGEKEVYSNVGRPFTLSNKGQPLKEIFHT